MAYSAEADVLLLIPSSSVAQLTDDTAGTTTDSAKVTRAIAQADAFINSYLRGRYTVPITGTAPDEIRDCSAWLAIANLFERRPSALSEGIPPTVKEKRDLYIKWLESCRDGKIVLSIDGGDANEESFIVTDKDDDDLVFTDDVLDQM